MGLVLLDTADGRTTFSPAGLPWTEGQDQVINVTGGVDNTHSLRQEHNGNFLGTDSSFASFMNTVSILSGFAYNVRDNAGAAQYQTIFQLMDGTTYQIRFILLENVGGGFDNTIRIEYGAVIDEISGFTFVVGTTYKFQVKAVAHASAGSLEIKINGTTVFTKTGLNTARSGNAQFNRVYIHGALSLSTHTTDMDDVFTFDDFSHAYLGDPVGLTYFPDANGNYSQWTPSAGTNYQNVDDPNPDSDSTYNEDAGQNTIDTYMFPDIAGGIVAGIKASMWIGAASGSPTVQLIYRINSVDYAGGSFTPGTYFYGVELSTLSPATGVAWTVTELNGLELGIKRTSATGVARISQMVLEVLYDSLYIIVEPIAIASDEAFGTPTMVRSVEPTSIVGEEAFGSPSVASLIQPDGLSSDEAFGAPMLVLVILPAALATTEAFGAPEIARTINPSSLTASFSAGNPRVLSVRGMSRIITSHRKTVSLTVVNEAPTYDDSTDGP